MDSDNDSMAGFDETPVEIISDEDKKLIEDLQLEVKRGTRDVNKYLALVDILRKYKLEDDLESTRRLVCDNIGMPESFWTLWLEDESTTLTADDKILQLDRFLKAIQDHPHSVSLRLKHLDFLEEQIEDASAAECEEEIKAMFTHSMLDIAYAEAYEKCKFEISHSHQLFNRMIQKEMRKYTSGLIELSAIQSIYYELLSIPHLNITSTFTDFSTFVTNFDNENYDTLMPKGNLIYQKARQLITAREPFESILVKNNFTEEAFETYINWEQSQPAKSPHKAELLDALLQRAISRHPYVERFWHALYDPQKIQSSWPFIDRQEQLQRALRFCPANSLLWSYYILTHDIDSTLATSIISLNDQALAQIANGALQVQRSTYLVLRSGTTDHEVKDLTSDVPIQFLRQSIAWQNENNVFDSEFLLDRLLIARQSALNHVPEARAHWKKLSKTHGSQAMFWLQYFQWEVLQENHAVARSVVKSGCLRTKDAPQLLFDAATAFELQHGTVADYHKMIAVITKATEQFILESQAYQESTAVESASSEPQANSLKRSADEVDDTGTSKKAKVEEQEAPEKIRNREVTSVIARGIPSGTDPIEVKDFFRDCGHIKAMKLERLKTSADMVALLEFDDTFDMAAARTKTHKQLKGHELTVESARDTCLFVSNWPPSYGEDDLRDLFAPYGSIIEIRMPSLLYDQRRRFAYVQMCSRDEASKALQLDGKELGNEPLVLSVKISDPDAKQQRADASQESRELFVKHISWKASKEDVENLFKPYGTIVSLRMPSKISSKHHDGIAFIDFETSEEAKAALVLNDTFLKNRTLQVSLSEPRSKIKQSTVKHRNIRSEQAANGDNHSNGDAQAQATDATPERAEIGAKTLGVMGIPDTTNEEQIRKLFEPFGALRKVVLRPDHGGAVVEYEASADAGRASLKLEGHRIGTSAIRIGTFHDLMAAPSAQEKLMAPRAVRRKTTAAGAARGGRISLPAGRVTTVIPAAQSTEETKPAAAAADTDRHGQGYFRNLMTSKTAEEQGR